MTFIKDILSDVVALVLAVMLLVGLIAYFGTSPIERYSCDMMTSNPVAKTVCMMHIALD